MGVGVVGWQMRMREMKRVEGQGVGRGEEEQERGMLVVLVVVGRLVELDMSMGFVVGCVGIHMRWLMAGLVVRWHDVC